MQEIEAADAPQWKLSRVKDILRGGGRKAIVVDDEENIVDAIEYGVQIEEIYCSEGYCPEMEATAEILRPYETFRLAPATLARLFKAEKRSRIFAVAKAPRRRRLEDLRSPSSSRTGGSSSPSPRTTPGPSCSWTGEGPAPSSGACPRRTPSPW